MQLLFFFMVQNGKILTEKFVTQLYDHIELILVPSARVLRVSANADNYPLLGSKADISSDRTAD